MSWSLSPRLAAGTLASQRSVEAWATDRGVGVPSPGRLAGTLGVVMGTSEVGDIRSRKTSLPQFS